MNSVFDAIGWAGSIVLIVAYLLATRNVFPADSWQSLALNIFASVALTIYAIHMHAGPNVFINSVWLLIGLVALAKYFQTKNSANPSTANPSAYEAQSGE